MLRLCNGLAFLVLSCAAVVAEGWWTQPSALVCLSLSHISASAAGSQHYPWSPFFNIALRLCYWFLFCVLCRTNKNTYFIHLCQIPVHALQNTPVLHLNIEKYSVLTLYFSIFRVLTLYFCPFYKASSQKWQGGG